MPTSIPTSQPTTNPTKLTRNNNNSGDDDDQTAAIVIGSIAGVIGLVLIVLALAYGFREYQRKKFAGEMSKEAEFRDYLNSQDDEYGNPMAVTPKRNSNRRSLELTAIPSHSF